MKLEISRAAFVRGAFAAAFVAAGAFAATGASAETRVTYKSAKSTSSYYQMGVQIAEGMKAGSGGDIIVKANGEELGSMEDLIRIINDSEVGEEINLEVMRDGETREVTVTLGERPDATTEQAAQTQSGQ